ncbi:MAG TPA: GntR family transcriptional regulator [Devosia sp.]|nr:GntR family transcriptional regulator [Devosia sp.]
MNENFRLSELEDPVPATGNSSIGNRVFRVLREAIVQLQFRPGHLLSEAEMAKQIGVSRQPVREAFIKLAEIGLVEILPQRGTLVTLISAKEMENARFLREVIEVAIVRKLALIVSNEDIDLLRGMTEELDRIRQSRDVTRILRSDEEFHVKMAQLADCAYAWRILENLKTNIDRVRYLTLGEAGIVENVVSQHHAIVDALATRSPDLAEAAMRIHMGDIINSLPSMVTAYPDLFVD